MALRPKVQFNERLKQWFMVVKHDYESLKNKEVQFMFTTNCGWWISNKTFTRLSIFLGPLVVGEIKIDDKKSD